MDAASKKRFSSNLLPLHPALFVPPTAQKKQEEGHRVWVLSLDQFNSFFLPWLALLTDWTGCWGTKRERTAFRAALLIQGGLHTRAPPASVGRGGGQQLLLYTFLYGKGRSRAAGIFLATTLSTPLSFLSLSLSSPSLHSKHMHHTPKNPSTPPPTTFPPKPSKAPPTRPQWPTAALSRPRRRPCRSRATPRKR